MARVALPVLLVVFTVGACGAANSPGTDPASSPTARTSARATYSLQQGPKATPSFAGTGAAGVCTESNGDLVTVVFHDDVPEPKCAFVIGPEQLRVENEFDRHVNATLGHLSMSVPPGESVVVREPFHSYLDPGGHLLLTDLYDGDTYGMEIRFEPDGEPMNASG